MEFSKLGHRFTAHSGILQLMDDLGKAIAGSEEVCMLGGGNPSHIPQVEACFREQFQQILATPGRFEHMVGDYASPHGDAAVLADLAALRRRELGLADSVPVVGHVGRFSEPKNHGFLLQVFAEFATLHPDARLLLVGDGPLRVTI